MKCRLCVTRDLKEVLTFVCVCLFKGIRCNITGLIWSPRESNKKLALFCGTLFCPSSRFLLQSHSLYLSVFHILYTSISFILYLLLSISHYLSLSLSLSLCPFILLPTLPLSHTNLIPSLVPIYNSSTPFYLAGNFLRAVGAEGLIKVIDCKER